MVLILELPLTREEVVRKSGFFKATQKHELISQGTYIAYSNVGSVTLET